MGEYINNQVNCIILKIDSWKWNKTVDNNSNNNNTNLNGLGEFLYIELNNSEIQCMNYLNIQY